ncbi:MAG: dNTP triphosphohydrolase, broad substrate specificity, partial [uncultured Gemmatimonadaceae bacterium]
DDHHPRPALEERPRRRPDDAVRRHAGVPAAALRAAARARVPRLPGRHALALRARGGHLPPRAAHPRRPARRRRRRRLERRRGGDRARGRVAARRGALPLLARARGDRRAPPRGGRPPAALRGRARRRAACRAGRRRARARARAHPRREREPVPGAHLGLARPGQDRVPQARRAHVWRAVRRDRRRPPHGLAARAARPRDAPPGDRGDREGARRARVAPLRQVPDVPQRLLAPRGALGDGDVQAPRRRRALGADPRRTRARRLHRRGAPRGARAARAVAAPRRASRAPAAQARAGVPRRRAPRRRGRVDRHGPSPDRRRRGRAGPGARRRAGRDPPRLPGQGADARPRHPRRPPRRRDRAPHGERQRADQPAAALRAALPVGPLAPRLRRPRGARARPADPRTRPASGGGARSGPRPRRAAARL